MTGSILEHSSIGDLIVERLRALALFESLDREAISVLEEELEWLHLRAQEVLFEEGEPADSMVVVVSGRLDVLRRAPDGGVTVVARVPAGAPVGEMGLLSGAPRAASVR